MATADFTIKTGDTAPALMATLTDSLGTVVDLTGASVRFIMRDKTTGDKVIDNPCDVVSDVLGKVSYQWITGDTGVPDTFNGEFEVHFGDGRFETFPNAKNIIIKFFQDLGGLVTSSTL